MVTYNYANVLFWRESFYRTNKLQDYHAHSIVVDTRRLSQAVIHRFYLDTRRLSQAVIHRFYLNHNTLPELIPIGASPYLPSLESRRLQEDSSDESSSWSSDSDMSFDTKGEIPDKEVLDELRSHLKSAI